MIIPTMRMLLAGGRGGFSPLDLSPTAYLSADVGVTVSGSGVSLWSDRSSNGNDLSQGTDAARLSVTGSWRNSKPALAGAAGKFLRRASLTGGSLTQAFSVYVVGEWTTADNTANRFLMYGGAHLKQQGGLDGRGAAFAGSANVFVPLPTPSSAFIWRFSFDGASSEHRIAEHGSAERTATGDPGTGALTEITALAFADGNGAWEGGYMAELAVIPGTVSAEDDDAMFNYFSTKYSIIGA